MRHDVVRFAALVGLALIGAPRAAIADDAAPSAFIWYRSADGCPDGAEFVDRLAARGLQARLAEVGDPIDFVVTLGAGPDGARGSLEKQTNTGTVAIRRFDAGNCAQVADALALTLVMAAPARAKPADKQPETQSATATDGPSARSEAPLIRAAPVEGTDRRPVAPRSRTEWGFGIQGGVLSWVTPEPMLGSSLYAELQLSSHNALQGPSFRAGAFEAQSVTSGARQVSVFVGGGRLEGCPLGAGTGVVVATPCAAIDLGTIRTSGDGNKGRKDDGLWAAVNLLARLTARLSRLTSLEAQASAVVPLEQYDFVSSVSGNHYRAAPVGLSVMVGANVRLP